jgi:undecaprenyl-diphosphatase
MVIADVIAILLFSLIAQRIHLDKTSFVGIDMWFLHFFAQFPMMDTLMIWISQVFNLWFIGAIAILILGYLYRKKLFYYATVFISSMMCVLVAFPLLKLLIQRVRPSTALLTLNDFSFPSGHAAMSIVFCLLCWYVVHDQIEKKRIKYSFLVLMIACTGMIGISRLFLHVHRFTDVVAGFLLGFSLLATNILVWDIIFKTHLEGKKVIEKGSKKQLIDILL